MARSDDRPVIVIGPQPPPVTGASLVSARIVESLEALTTCLTLDTAGNQSHGPLRYHTSRLRKAALSLIATLKYPSSACYISLQGGHGKLYDIAFVLAARVRGHQLFLHHHSFRYINDRDRLAAVLCRLAGRARHIFLCESMKVAYCGTYGDRLHSIVLSNVAFMPPAAPDYERAGELLSVEIGHLSNLTVEKGVDVVAALADSVHRDVPGSRVTVVGPASDRESVDYLESGNVTWLGPLYGEEKEAYLSSLDLFVMPSRYKDEAEPLVVLEALRYGAKIVSTDCGCLPEVLAGSSAVVTTHDSFLRAAVDEASRISKDRARCEADRSADRRHYDAIWNRAVDALDDLIDDLAGRGD